VRGASNGTVDVGELAAVFLVPLPDGGRGVGGRIGHAGAPSGKSVGHELRGPMLNECTDAGRNVL